MGPTAARELSRDLGLFTVLVSCCQPTSGAMYAGVPTVDLGWLSSTDLL
jgi:hypothetical protein